MCLCLYANSFGFFFFFENVDLLDILDLNPFFRRKCIHFVQCYGFLEKKLCFHWNNSGMSLEVNQFLWRQKIQFRNIRNKYFSYIRVLELFFLRMNQWFQAQMWMSINTATSQNPFILWLVKRHFKITIKNISMVFKTMVDFMRSVFFIIDEKYWNRQIMWTKHSFSKNDAVFKVKLIVFQPILSELQLLTASYTSQSF